MPETLSGVIERITFHNLDTGYCVLRVQANALPFQERELVGDAALVERTVGAFHLVPAGTDDGGERKHAAATDAAKKIGFGL